VAAIDDITKVAGQSPLIWVDFDGPIDQASLKQLGELFELHPLSLEDVVNSRQRAKVEHYPKYHFVVTRMVSLGERLQSEQLSIFFGKDFVLSFQEKNGGDCLEPLRDSLRRGGALTNYTPDYLAYAIIDTVVDGYFPVIKELGDRLNDLEEEIFKRFDQNHTARIHAIKRDIWALRQTIWPVRDSLTVLLRDSASLIANETRYYLRDCYDHSIRIIEMVESHISMCADLMDLHMSRENSRMNEILRVLTIISTLFIPPTFIAGIYGMNFNPDKSPLNMPELNWYLGYPMALAIMALMMGGLIFWMWWKGWLTGVPRGKRFRLSSRREKNEKK
jgi:magnesium transporter